MAPARASTLKNPEVESSDDPPLKNPLEELLGYQLRRASQSMLGDFLAALEELELRPSSVSVLELIGSNPGITQSRIGQILAVERGNMVPLAAKLTTRGLLRRSRADGRSHGLHLTAEGKAVLAKARKRIAEHEGKFWKDAKAAEKEALLTFLKSLWKGAG